MGKPVGSRFGANVMHNSGLVNFVRKSRLPHVQISYSLPKNGRLGLGLVSNMALKKRNHESPLGTFRPEKQDYLFTVLVCFQMFRYFRKFSAGTTHKGVFHLVSNWISGNFL